MYEFAGGYPAFLALASAHHARCLQDPELSHPFSHGVDPEHITRLAAYWAEVFGGPATYSDSHGGHSSMLSIHAGTGAGDDYGPRFVACFMQAADDAGLPPDIEFRNSLRSYIEWAVAEVLSYAPHGSQVREDQPVPRWSWSGRELTPTDGLE